MKSIVMANRSSIPRARDSRVLIGTPADEAEFLSSGGIRVFVKYHEQHPYTINISGVDYTIKYDPGDLPRNFSEAIPTGGVLYGFPSLPYHPVDPPVRKILWRWPVGGIPCGSGNKLNLEQVANELTERVVSLFGKTPPATFPWHGKYNWFYQRPENQHLLLFYEYFTEIPVMAWGQPSDRRTSLIAN